MKRLSTARKLCVLLHDSSFSALPPEQISSSRFSALSVCGPPHAVPSSALRRTASMHLDATFPLLNLHRVRVRRNRERLPSSRCIESAPEHHASILTLLSMRASDTSLGLLDRLQNCRQLPTERATDRITLEQATALFLVTRGRKTHSGLISLGE